jgi:hypothetical protein
VLEAVRPASARPETEEPSVARRFLLSVDGLATAQVLDPASTGLEHESRAAERCEDEQDTEGLRPEDILHDKPT